MVEKVVRQLIWKFLMEKDFVFEFEDEWASAKKVLHLCKNFSIRQKIDKTSDGTNLILDLKKFLLLHKNVLKIRQIKLVWNYLGSSSERQIYLNYLNQIFWENQTDEKLLQVSNYRQLLEKSFLIANYFYLFEQNFLLPSDFWEEKTVTFFSELNQKMAGFEYQPFLVHSNAGSLQWQLHIDSKMFLNGVIYNQKGSLWQAIDTAGFDELETN